MTIPLLGAHMSIAGGVANALYRGSSIGCDAIQMFTRNANRWVAKDLEPEDIVAFDQARRETRIEEIVAHSSYLINLASPDDTLHARSVEALITELGRCAQLGIRKYVLHPGSSVGSAEQEGLQRVAASLREGLAATDDAVTVLLETTAGQGSVLGRSFEQLAWLLEHTEPATRLGVCFDTAHALASGYDFRSRDTYEEMWHRFETLIGRELLGCIHVNDSKANLGSNVDRHIHIGEGYVGLEAFRLLVNDTRLHHAPMLLETPKSKDMAEDIRNLGTLRALVGLEESVANISLEEFLRSIGGQVSGTVEQP